MSRDQQQARRLDRTVVWHINPGGTYAPGDPLPPTPAVPPGACVVLSGRGPTWRFGRAQHAVHGVAAAVAIHDPKLGGAVVVASHLPGLAEGEVVAVADDADDADLAD